MSETKEVVKVAPAGVPATYDYGDDAGAGFEGTKGSDLSVPFLGVLQANSPQVEDNKNGKLIKRTFAIEFGKGDEKWADKFERDCAQRVKPLNIKRKKGVHSGTLQAFIKKALEEGVDIPLDVFGAYRQRFAKIKMKA